MWSRSAATSKASRPSALKATLLYLTASEVSVFRALAGFARDFVIYEEICCSVYEGVRKVYRVTGQNVKL